MAIIVNLLHLTIISYRHLFILYNTMGYIIQVFHYANTPIFGDLWFVVYNLSAGS